MPFDAQGFWYPEMSAKQIEVYNSNSRYTLVSGPRRTGKTLVNMHRLVKHAMEVPQARIGIFPRTVKNAKAGGCWNDLVDIILPEWFRAGVTRYTTIRPDKSRGPKQDAQTRMMYLKIKNLHGGESEFQLHSIDNLNEVEAIAKGTRFSCFYFPELSNYPYRDVFDVTSEQLRIPGLPFEDHLWLADTNPADEGEDSWIYKLWWTLRAKPVLTDHERFMLNHLKLFEIMIPDNPYLTEIELKDLYARYSHDPDLYARYIEGRWVRASEDAIFRQQFDHAVHIIGDNTALDEKDWDILLPSEHCTGLVSGWDLGDRFMSSHIIEPIQEPDKEGKSYCVIDEIVQIDPDVLLGLEEYCEAFTNRYNEWTRFCCGDGKIPNELFEWRHWSDKAALQNWRSHAETYDKNLVYRYTNGEVMLEGAPKFPGSIGKRIQIVKILLFERRLLVSARCIATIAMFKTLRSGTGAKLIDHRSPYRHVFDSLSYALSAEEPALLMQAISDSEEKEEAPLIRVPL